MPGLSAQVFIGMGLGLAAGVFFGERITVVNPIGSIFIGLLQMTVLPYMFVSLVGGLGRLSPEDARILGVRGGIFIVLFWGIALLAVVATAITFPGWESAAFFSTSLVETGGGKDLLTLYIPSNPFSSFSNGVVPAVVLFSVAMGLALLPLKEKKQPLLALLDTVSAALMSVATFVVHLAPIGVFALIANTAGTMSLEEFGRLQVYIYSYVAVVLFLCFWVIPGLVSALLPIPHRRVLTCAQDALVTAFATGSLLIVLPLLSERMKEVLQEMGAGSPDTEGTVDIVVPINFSLPNLGKIMALAFVPFAGWFSGFQMAEAQYPAFLGSGLVSLFGEVVVALPFLLDSVRIPADMFHLFLSVAIFTGPVGTLLAGIHTIALALLIGGSVGGFVRLSWAKLGRYLAITGVLTVAVVAGMRLFHGHVLPHEYRQYESLVRMKPLSDPVPTTIHESPPQGDVSPGTPRLRQVYKRGALRVGYLGDRLPYVFRNEDGELVGFEVDMARVLAKDLEVKLEFVPVEVDPKKMTERLERGQCDVVMSGLVVTPERAIAIRFTEPYLKSTVAFLVRDHDRELFGSARQIHRLKNPRIGVLRIPYYIEALKRYLPQAEIVLLDSPRDFFGEQGKDLDAMLDTAEGGSAWTLIYPAYSVAIPHPDVLAAPMAYAVSSDAGDLLALLNSWLSLKRDDRTIEELYRHWILGAGVKQQKPRWSVVRDVLHWAE
jgi:proton glutamate symport protein